MNSTSFFYAHTDQWRYEKVGDRRSARRRSPTGEVRGSLHDRLQRARRAHGLAARARRNCRRESAAISRDAAAAPAWSRRNTSSKRLKDGSLEISCADPDHPDNWPRNMFVWRSNILGSIGQGTRVFPEAPARHAATASGQRPGETTKPSPSEVTGTTARRRQARPAGDARLPHEHDVPLRRHRAAHRHLVREGRPQHQRHASVHPSVVDRG